MAWYNFNRHLFEFFLIGIYLNMLVLRQYKLYNIGTYLPRYLNIVKMHSFYAIFTFSIARILMFSENFAKKRRYPLRY